MAKSRLFTLMILLASGSLLKCGENHLPDTPGSSVVSSGGKVVAKRIGQVAPCDLLTPEILAAEFNIDASVLEAKPFGKTMCTYNWPKPNQAEIDQRNEALMAEFLPKRLQAMKRGETLVQPTMENSYVNISLTVVDMKDDARASTAFSKMIETMAAGVSAEKDGEKATFRMNYDQAIDDIGDQAAWTSKGKQLSFRVGSVFLHVMVDQSQDSAQNLRTAKSLAKRIIASI